MEQNSYLGKTFKNINISWILSRRVQNKVNITKAVIFWNSFNKNKYKLG